MASISNNLHDFAPVNRAFSKQSHHYDADDAINPVLTDMRRQVYKHVLRFLKPSSHLLELNAGTGIDACFFAALGHNVHATDLSDGMVEQIQQKISGVTNGQLTCQQLSYDQLQALGSRRFDYVFSNFGGLNCIADLSLVTRHLPTLLKPGGYVTWVVMPPICVWELSGIIKGRFSGAFRRFKKGGVVAHLEGEYFNTYYHSLSKITKAFGDSFTFINSEGLAAITPQPHRGDFPSRYPATYKILKRMDKYLGRHFPFDRCADHIIVTFQFQG